MKKLYHIFLILILVLLLSAVSGLYLTSSRFTSTFTATLSTERFLSMQQDSSPIFVFDTGAHTSLLFTDTIPEHFFNTHIATKISDTNNRIESYLYLYTWKASLSWMELERFYCIFCKKGNHEELENIGGILGSNIILRYNWSLDFSKKTISCLEQGIEPPFDFAPDLVLPFKKKNGELLSDIVINGITLDKIKIDTGSALGDLELPPEDLVLIEGLLFQEERTANGLHSSSTHCVYHLPSGCFNGLPMDSLVLTSNPHSRLLGASFFRRFSSVFIDTKRRTIACKL